MRTLSGDLPPGMLREAEAVYSRLLDERNPGPHETSEELIEHLRGVAVPSGDGDATGSTVELASGDRVGVLTTGNDVLFMVHVGNGWKIIAAFLDGAEPWVDAPSPRHLLVLGTDARVGERQLGFRADSVHILSMIPATGQGAFVGFPRDSWIRDSKLTNLMPAGGPELMMEVIHEISGLDLEGWVAVGFEGFLGLMDALGPLDIDLPSRMRSGNNWADYPAGPQRLSPQLALRLARIRKGLPRGDFDRSFNHGLITLAAMTMIQLMGVEMFPHWVAVYDTHGFTDLETEALATWLASAYLASPESITNLVLPARNGRVGEAAVVFIEDEAEDIFRDLDDGVLDDS